MPPKPSPTPSPEPRRSRAGEQASSTGSGKGSEDLVGDPGPAFEPGTAAAQEAPAPPLEPVAPPEWKEDQVRAVLSAQGGLTHVVLGGDEKLGAEAWLHTEADLAAIAPPLTRILNRYPATQAAAAGGDFFVLGIGAIGYGTRSVVQMRQYQAWLAAQGPQPVPGSAPADVGTGPDDEPGTDLGTPFTPAQA